MAEIKKKEKDTKVKKKKSKKTWKGILYTCLLIGFILIIVACIAVTVFFVYIAKNAPAFDEMKLYTHEPSNIYSADGNKIATIGTEDRVILSYDQLPEVLVNAIVATEDSRFFQHNGVDLPRFLKASLLQLRGTDAGGASTLTMQISKNVYTSKEASGWDGIVRKFTDVYMAVFKIEPSYSKEQIIEFYVNSFFLGNGYGVEVTSKNYFGKSAKDLNVAEAALIAGLFQAPGAYNPYTNPEATEDRRQRVLSLMLRHNYITEEEYEIAKKMTVDKIVKEKSNTDIASGLVNPDYQQFIDMVIQDVKDKTGESPYTKSMDIYTTLDEEKQKYVSDVMNGENHKWADSRVQGGVAVVNVNTGAIAAIGGGRNVKEANTLNRAINLNHQIGSTAKPLYDYGPAIEHLNWNTGTILYDGPYKYSNGTPVHNAYNSYLGYNTITEFLKQSKNIPALKAFQATSNDDKVKFVTSLGLAPEIYSCDDGYTLKRNKCINKENANDIKDAKITKPLHEAHSIGGYNGESPLTMAAAYAAFANGGYYNEPYSFSKIVYNDTGDVYINKTNSKQVMSEATAYMITYMLQKTAEYGIDTKKNLKNINNIPYALKTGTTNYDEEKTKQCYKIMRGYKQYVKDPVPDLWAIGYNTEYAIGVWHGYDKIQDGCNSTNSGAHTTLFVKIAKGIWKSKSDFKKPSSVVEVTTENYSGTSLLPSEATPTGFKTKSLFISGTEPNKVSTRFNQLANPTGVKATNNGNGTATVSWNAIATPDALNKNYLENYLDKKEFPGKDFDNYSNNAVGSMKGILGEVGYNVYVEVNGQLELKGWTKDTSYQITANDGNHKIVVKSCYSKYKANMSSGEATNVNITGSPIVQPTPTNPEENTDNQEGQEQNQNQDQEQNNQNSQSNPEQHN